MERNSREPHMATYGIMGALAACLRMHGAMKDADRQALGVIWKVRLENARNRYEAAKATVQGVRDFQSLPFPDDSFALDHALLAECRALAEFKRVVTIFCDLV